MFISYEVVKLGGVYFMFNPVKTLWEGSLELWEHQGSKPKCLPGGKILAKEVLIRDQDQCGSIAPKSLILGKKASVQFSH